jgi:hypothetical protein
MPGSKVVDGGEKAAHPGQEEQPDAAPAADANEDEDDIPISARFAAPARARPGNSMGFDPQSSFVLLEAAVARCALHVFFD